MSKPPVRTIALAGTAGDGHKPPGDRARRVNGGRLCDKVGNTGRGVLNAPSDPLFFGL